jgi:hypothetical protein
MLTIQLYDMFGAVLESVLWFFVDALNSLILGWLGFGA